MDKFQQFVNRIPGHIRWVLVLKGGNNYKEGTSPPDELWEAFLRERQAEIDRGEFLVRTAEAIENWEEIVETQGGDEESENSDLDSF